MKTRVTPAGKLLRVGAWATSDGEVASTVRIVVTSKAALTWGVAGPLVCPSCTWVITSTAAAIRTAATVTAVKRRRRTAPATRTRRAWRGAAAGAGGAAGSTTSI